MNSDDNKNYNPADDDNQGVVQLLAQSEEANAGIPQANYMNPARMQGPEPEKAEVDGIDSVGINDDLLAEETVEEGNADEEEE
ncbi:hypothetical protein WBJ53_22070 [Spirosoma sp. SC4-14]|uniref:hypothetical protein n=1 Tax=Spirosoma sp. SC4-14 TaxID=3128900 RepID=UPI0030CAB9AF